ncbi:tripartite motif-containing protein 3-like [Saccostrea cucullata]|uniref:tripartite motif-containing protein 3-like n=1 Tax=Saccostrea cuccullata TaxID=36930 RepID=UPI002ED4281D
MYNTDTETGKVVRYSSRRKNIQTIQHVKNTGQGMYREPIYITENCNGDVIVSDYNHAVVVTDRDGKYRFSYTGHPLGSRIRPLGICTDKQSHILVGDFITRSVHIVDENGHFLLQMWTVYTV